MTLRFSAQPGRHERHLQRRHQNPLFGNPAPEVTRGELDRSRPVDRQEAEEFDEHFVKLVEQAAGLQPNEDSDVLLKLKEGLDQAYEQASGLAGDRTAIKQGIVKLVGVIMQAVRKGAGSDPTALDELRQEDMAREMHFGLLAYPLVADLLAPESTIAPDELAPALLSADADEMRAVMRLFDPPQQQQLLEDAKLQVGALPDGADADLYRSRLELMQQCVAPESRPH